MTIRNDMTQRSINRRVLAVIIGVLLTVAAPFPGHAGPPPLSDPKPRPAQPRIDGRLADEPSGAVTVEVFGNGGSRAVLRALAAVGASDVVAVGDAAIATLPASALAALGADPQVRWVRPASLPYPEAVTGQGVAFIDANDWQAGGVNGAGVKVAIVDLGFAGYTSRQAQGDLPPSLTTIDRCPVSGFTGEAHGTAVAEIVHEVAPGAQLYLVCVDDLGDLALAVDDLAAAGVRVINHSVGWFNTGRGDGTGLLEPIVTAARDAGIVWVNSAGNYRETHWGGPFADSDADGWLDFASGDSTNTFTLGAGNSVTITMRWDDWPASDNDYDLYLYRDAGGGSLVEVARSDGTQTGTQPPTEELSYTNTGGVTQTLHTKVFDYATVGSPEIDLFFLNGQSGIALQYSTAARSVADPASSPIVTAAGAARVTTGAIESFSSRGPTIAGTLKPDLTGPDRVSGATYGTNGFSGTSAAAPHVAGAAALILDASPCLTVDEVRDLLVALTEDRGTAGPDNDYGSGLLRLGAPAPVADTSGCVRRYAGANRYATAATISATDFPDPNAVDTVFVATGLDFPDGLAGGATAARLGAPLLLVNSSGVPSETADELTRLSPDTIVIVGGTAVVPDAVKTTLEGYAPTVIRVFGANRYDTAIAISHYGFPTPGTADTVFVATGLNFPDALAAGPAAAFLNGPVLLVPGTAPDLPQSVADEILRLDPATIVVVGGTGAVSTGIYDDLDTLQGSDTVTRISGADRYATAAAIATYAFTGGADRAYIATGLNFPDALAGAAAAGWWGSPILLVPGSSLPTAVSAEVTRETPTRIAVLGGAAVVTVGVEQSLEDLIS